MQRQARFRITPLDTDPSLRAYIRTMSAKTQSEVPDLTTAYYLRASRSTDHRCRQSAGSITLAYLCLIAVVGRAAPEAPSVNVEGEQPGESEAPIFRVARNPGGFFSPLRIRPGVWRR